MSNEDTTKYTNTDIRLQAQKELEEDGEEPKNDEAEEIPEEFMGNSYEEFLTKLTSSDDEEWSKRHLMWIAEGDQLALERFYEKWQFRIQALAFKRLCILQDAESATNAWRFRIWKEGLRYDPSRGVNGWIFMHAKQACWQVYRERECIRLPRPRKPSVTKTPSCELIKESGPQTTGLPQTNGKITYVSTDELVALNFKATSLSPHDELEKKEKEELTQKALSKVEGETREALILREVDGLTYQQIADLLKIPLNTLKTRIFNGRRFFRKQFLSLLAQPNSTNQNQGKVDKPVTKLNKKNQRKDGKSP